MTLLYKRCLKFIGILPFEGRDLTYLGSRIALAYSLTTSFVSWSMIMFYTISAKNGLTVDGISESTAITGEMARQYLLTWRRLRLAHLLEECRQIWDMCDEGGRRAVRRFERKIRMLFLFIVVISFAFNVLYSVSAVTMTLDASKTTDLNDTPPRYLPYKWYVEDGANLWPGYEIIFAVQLLVINNQGIVIATVDSMGPLLIVIAAGYFQALRQQLLDISKNYDESANVASRLVDCVRLHQRILNLCSGIDAITRILFFPQLLCCCYNLSLVGIKLIGSDPDRYKYIPFAVGILGQLFICQWAPDHLLDEGLAIATAAYSTSLTWTKSRLGKFLVLVIARSQRPIQMTALGLFKLSLENFRYMLSSAASFFTVLRNFTG